MENFDLANLPSPVSFKLLTSVPKFETVDPMAARLKEIGLVVADSAARKEEAATVVVQVVALGPDAYKDPAKFTGPWCAVGDYVLIRAYSGTRFFVGAREFRIINDDAVEATVPDPQGISRTYS